MDKNVVHDRGFTSDFLGMSMMDRKIADYLQIKKIDSLLVTNAVELIHFVKTSPGELKYLITATGSDPVVTNEITDVLSEYLVDGLIYTFYVDEAFFQEKLILEALSRFNKRLIRDSNTSIYQHQELVNLSDIIQNHLKSPSPLISNAKFREEALLKNSPLNKQLIDRLLTGFDEQQVVLPADLDEQKIFLLIAYINELGLFLDQTKSGRDVLEHLLSTQKKMSEDETVSSDLNALYKLINQRNAEFLKDFGSPSLFVVKKESGTQDRSVPLSFVFIVCSAIGFFLSLMVLFCLSWRFRAKSLDAVPV